MRANCFRRAVGACSIVVLLVPSSWSCARGEPFVLDAADFAHYVHKFNSLDNAAGVSAPADGAVPNEKAWDWMQANVPLFSCPDAQLEQTYYFRWWTLGKHIRRTPHGLVLTEFLEPVGHAGPYNTISCAYGHHLAEGRWMRDRRPLDEYTHFWFRSGPNGGPAEHFHKYSSWAAAALYDRYLVTLDREIIVDLLDDLVADYEQWEVERQRPDGLFWQYDVRDGMEESISGSRTVKHIRPTINSYMAANARAISQIATLAGRRDIADRFHAKFETLQAKLVDALWDPDARFFKVRFEDDELSDAREAIGFVPWMFDLAGPEHAAAWLQLNDPAGFSAPRGLTTAERRHPDFRSHGVGTCEWDGAVWPFATSQTLNGLANLLRGPAQPHVTRSDFFSALQTYARAHAKDGKPYIGEYHDEMTGDWLITGPKAARSRDYNHSTFCDLVIGGLVGMVPSADDTVEVDPLLPAKKWEWFCLDGVPYHGRLLTVVWDRTGDRYHRGAGLAVWADGREVARQETLGRIVANLPPNVASE
ncbi:MAG: glycoside hydrolase [Planctomycetes bacterium]|nr:glycoside hydrolase [Planctomycetota bacterium]